LKDSIQTSRHQVMLAHMEADPPDILQLRRENIPQAWSEEIKGLEQAVPGWLLEVIKTCLQKKPGSRYADGMQLHDTIVRRNSGTATTAAVPVMNNQNITELMLINEQLEKENARLQQEVRLLQQERTNSPQPAAINRTSTQKKWAIGSLLPLFILALAIGAGYYFYKRERAKKSVPAKTVTQTESAKAIGQFMVKSARAYFYTAPDEAMRREAFMVPSSEIVTGLKAREGFVYTEFTNSKGQTSKGWLRRSDLMTLEEWKKKEAEESRHDLTTDDIDRQLQDARRFMKQGQVAEAAFIYQYLSEQQVPEAMYEWGNIGLQRKTESIDCGRAYDLVKQAAEKNYAPAKRTLGLLYIFADNSEVLQINNYEQCSYERNVFKGSKLMVEAMMSGDTTAKRLVEELNINPDNAGGGE
jgi:eukaryotic-like serine/threonine-protein kinase